MADEARGRSIGEGRRDACAGRPAHAASRPPRPLPALALSQEPIARFQGQATDIELQRLETRNTKKQLVEILTKNTGKKEEEIDADILRPKYFTPAEAITYGLIDKVLLPNPAAKVKLSDRSRGLG